MTNITQRILVDCRDLKIGESIVTKIPRTDGYTEIGATLGHTDDFKKDCFSINPINLKQINPEGLK